MGLFNKLQNPPESTLDSRNQFKMSLTQKDKEVVKALWQKISSKADDIGADALYRMLTVYPQTKTYFSHWTDMGKKSAQVRNHGKRVMGGLGEAVANIDNIKAGLIDLSEKHALKMRVDPANYKILAHNIIVAIANVYPADFTPQAHLALDKFMANVALALSERYR